MQMAFGSQNMQQDYKVLNDLASKKTKIQQLKQELLKIKQEHAASEAKIQMLEQENLKIKEESLISHAQVKMTDWQKEFLPKYFGSLSDCFVHFDQHESCALLVGKHESVNKYKLALLNKLDKLIVRHFALTPAMHSILSKELGKQYLHIWTSSKLENGKILVQNESLLVISKDNTKLNSTMEFLERELNHKESMEFLVKIPTEKLHLLCSMLEQRLLVSCSVNGPVICVEGIKNDVVQSINEIRKFATTLSNRSTDVPVGQSVSEENLSFKEACQDFQDKLQREQDNTKPEEDSEIHKGKNITGLHAKCTLQDRIIQDKSVELTPAEIPRRGTCEFLRYAADSAKLIPSYWNLNSSINCKTRLWPPVKAVISNKSEEQSILVDVDTKTKDAIKTLITNTFDLNELTIEVIDVKRVENLKLFESYLAQRQFFVAKTCEENNICPDIEGLIRSNGRIVTTEQLDKFMKDELYYEVNEHYLFRGTRNPASMCLNGIATPVSSEGAIYLAEEFTYSDQFTDSEGQSSNPGKMLTMILARVLLGNVFVCTDSVAPARPPCMTCQNGIVKCNCADNTLYDSVMMDKQNEFRDFVIYDRNKFYPEYLIYYQRI